MTDEPEAQGEPWLSLSQQHEWASLMALVMTLPTQLDAQLKRDAGLNQYEYHVLATLAEAPEQMRVMSELAARSRGTLSRLSHAVSRLEAAGWVQRRSCGGAGRRTEARLTEAGRRKLEQAAPGHVREARRLVIDALSAEQLEDLGAAARRIVAVAAPEMTGILAPPDARSVDAS
jgi:DNA-binding MarR family transcriptional regulator